MNNQLDEYIKREDVLSYIYATHSSGGFKREDDYLWLHDRVINAASADVQPVKHGRWECVGHDDKTYWYRCSVCGHEEHDNMTKHDNYCGNCGARMDLGDEKT